MCVCVHSFKFVRLEVSVFLASLPASSRDSCSHKHISTLLMLLLSFVVIIIEEEEVEVLMIYIFYKIPSHLKNKCF